MATAMGVDLLTEQEYFELQSLGENPYEKIELDKNTC